MAVQIKLNKTRCINLVILILLATLMLSSCHQPEPSLDFPVQYEFIDSLILEEKLEQFTDLNELPAKETMIHIAKSFLGAPYISKSLETSLNEELVINLSGFDCTTFVESCLALSKTINNEKPSFNTYAQNLKEIRYRDGVLDGYTSRLHYFTDWISNNETKNVIRIISKEMGGIPFHKTIDFMSTHPKAYIQIKADSSLVPIIQQQEAIISNFSLDYIPKDMVADRENELSEGDIIGITTGIKGLDIIHTGILVKKDKRIHLLHASSDFKKVMITEKPLADYLTGNKLQTGIMVVEVR